jgi:hypothetical protein
LNDPQQWKGVLSILANENLRLAAAELILEEAARSGRPLAEGQRRKARDRLMKSGLFRSGDGAFNSSFVMEILGSAKEPGSTSGVERFLAQGRIETYPTRARHRDEVLAWACSKVISGAEVLSEKVINERLKTVADDYALLRRYLVDGGWLVRTASGSEYSLAPTPPASQG